MNETPSTRGRVIRIYNSPSVRPYNVGEKEMQISFFWASDHLDRKIKKKMRIACPWGNYLADAYRSGSRQETLSA